MWTVLKDVSARLAVMCYILTTEWFSLVPHRRSTTTDDGHIFYSYLFFMVGPLVGVFAQIYRPSRMFRNTNYSRREPQGCDAALCLYCREE